MNFLYFPCVVDFPPVLKSFMGKAEYYPMWFRSSTFSEFLNILSISTCVDLIIPLYTFLMILFARYKAKKIVRFRLIDFLMHYLLLLE